MLLQAALGLALLAGTSSAQEVPTTLRMREPRRRVSLLDPVGALQIRLDPPPPVNLTVRSLPEGGAGSGIDAALESEAGRRLRRRSVYDPTPLPTEPLFQDWDVAYDLRVQNGQFRSFSVLNPSQGLSLEFGQIGINNRNPLVTTSPYALLRKDWELESRFVDSNISLQGGVLNLNARFFYDDNPALDARADQAIAAATDLAGSLRGQFAVDPQLLKDAPGWFSYPTAYESATMAMGGALVHAGKTFHLVGPLDVGYVVGTTVRWAWRFPNAALDEALALRLRATPNLSVGLFGGVTEALGFIRRDMWAETIQNEDFAGHTHLDAAPHVSAAVWGAIPRLGGSYLLEGGHQFNPYTGVSHVKGGVTIPAGPVDITAGGRFEYEAGPDIEFTRMRGSAEVGVRPLPGLEAYASYGHEEISYGGVGLNNDLFMIGLRAEDRSGPRPQSASLEFLLGGKDNLILPPSDAMELLEQLKLLADVLSATAMIRDGQVAQGWDQVTRIFFSLDPDLQKAISDYFAENNPDIPLPLNLIFLLRGDQLPASLVGTVLEKLKGKIPEGLEGVTPGQIAKVASFLDGVEVYERLVIRYARHRLIEELEGRKIPIWGQNLQLNAPTVLALAHVFNLSLSPIPPVTTSDARNALDPFLFKQLKNLSGQCPDAANEQDYATCLVNLLPKETADALLRIYGNRLGPLLSQAIQWHSDLLRREMNRTMLELLLASEALNDLALDKGRRIGELDTAWLIESFKKMDRPQRKAWKRVLSGARSTIEAELKEQEEALAKRLKDYGKQRLRELNAAGGAKLIVADKDWAPLLANYGDRELFAFLLKARDTLKKGDTLTVSYTPFTDIGIVAARDERGTSIKLPPVTGSAKPKRVLDLAADAL